MEMVIVKGIWLDVRCQLGYIECMFNSEESYWRNIKLITKFELLLSEYLVGTWLMGDKKLKLKESAMIKRLSLMEEW